MHTRRGFTLIELMITMAIMVILVGVAIVSLRGSQANARDAKRASDVETIARGLEQRYDAGMAEPTDGSQVYVAGHDSSNNPTCDPSPLSYAPAAQPLQITLAAAHSPLDQQLALVQPILGFPPTKIDSTAALEQGTYPTTEELSYVQGANDQLFCPNTVSPYLTEDLPGTTDSNFAAPDGGKFVLATSATPPSAATVGNNYYYLPLTNDGSICNTIAGFAAACVKFTLYYVSEVDGTLHSIASKHQ